MRRPKRRIKLTIAACCPRPTWPFRSFKTSASLAYLIVIPLSVAYNAIIDGGAAVASITIRNIEETLKTRLRVQAAFHGRSMEDEA